jgi:MFS family permease
MISRRFRIFIVCFIFARHDGASSSSIFASRPIADTANPSVRAISSENAHIVDNLHQIRAGSTLLKVDPKKDAMKKSSSKNENSMLVVQFASFLTVLSTTLVAFAPASALVSKLGSVDKTTSLLSSLTAGAAVLEIVCSPFIGTLLDIRGRKPVFLGVLAAIAISQGSVVISGESIWSLCACKVFALLGVGLFFQIIGQAILSDLTGSSKHPERLSSALGMQAASISAGFLVGALCAGQLLSRFGLSLSYGIAAMLTTMNLLLVTFAMPETLQSTSKQQLVTRPKTSILSSLLGCTRILTKYDRPIPVLAFVFVLQCLPSFMGDFFQIYCKTEWNLDTKAFSSFVAIFGVLGLAANILGSILVNKLGIRRYTAVTSFLIIIPSIGASFFGFQGLLVGYLFGFLGLAQNLGIMAAMVSEAKQQGIPIGELAGQRASLIALVKVIGPIWYSTLYVQGQRLWNIPSLPFMFNACLGILVFCICHFYV